MNLVIVESPAKAKTINKYLGSDYTVLASYGHIRDLPSKNGSVDPENSFKMIWEIDSFSKKYLKEITDSVRNSEKIILATDPDREGEAIAWHVKEFLNENFSIFLSSSWVIDVFIFRFSFVKKFKLSVQNSSGLKTSISCSLSVHNLRATDWTLPADLDPGNFVHKIGEILKPTK